MYDPSVGRFISSDPAKAGTNWYAYCENNPLLNTDVQGLDISGHRPFLDEPGAIVYKGERIPIPVIPWTFRLPNSPLYIGMAPPLFPGGAFTADQNALIQLAKEAARRGGVSEGEGDILIKWGQELGLPSRGPELHPGRPFGKFPHIHIGPVNHIPIK